MKKCTYLVIYPDFLELPVDLYFSIKSLAKSVGVSVPQMQKIIRLHLKVKNRFYEVVE